MDCEVNGSFGKLNNVNTVETSLLQKSEENSVFHDMGPLHPGRDVLSQINLITVQP